MEKTIHYGFGKDYLSNWSITEALREVYQNFLDYGEYTEDIRHLGGIDKVSVSNAWQPESLDFLRIGNSKKNNVNAIGKHGEGLKMAFLILLREGYKSSIITQKYEIWPDTYVDSEIGECFCLRYEEHGLDPSNVMFTITFECDQSEFESFKANIITADDVIFDDNYFGQIVNKQAGMIYSGGLFVTKAEGIGKAYNIRPHHLPLDRDRSVPRSFDLSYAASKINQSQGKITTKDLSFSDALYIDSVPEVTKKKLKAVQVGNSIKYTYKDEKGKSQILTNSNLEATLHKDSFFQRAINKIKKLIAKDQGLYDLLSDFNDKHKVYLSAEGKQALEVIMTKAAKEFKIPAKKASKQKEKEDLPF
ncbi:hypothetical protein [Sphingobacterium mizutaii]|uniref:hypothetical protein n=1 Tax=Sphingobacterium mizutaii TaxID=1010 RepID=UPI00289B9B81|nr:hypothetical protein [Sphingobacterium mizutaii]